MMRGGTVTIVNQVNGRFTNEYMAKNGMGAWKKVTRKEIDDYLANHYVVLWNPNDIKRVSYSKSY